MKKDTGKVGKTILFGMFYFIFCFILLELGIRFLPVTYIQRSLRWISLAESEMISRQIHPIWGISYVPNIDVTLDYTGRERIEIQNRLQTIPIPGYPEYGMRDDGLDPESQTVIPVFGDSFTFGATIEQDQIWCELIENKYPSIDMLNLANGGGIVKAYEQYRILRDVLPPHDYVIYAMWLGNEFMDNYGLSECQSQLNAIRDEFEKKKRINRIVGRSKLLSLLGVTFNYLGRISKNTGTTSCQYAKGEYLGEKTPQLWNDKYGHFFLHPNNLMLVRYCEPEYPDERIAIGIRQTKAHLIKFKETVGARKLIIILFPFKEQVYEDIVKPHRPELELTKPNRVMMDFCVENNIDCHDTMAFIKKNKSKKMYWEYDPHFNAEGHRIASIKVEEILRELGVIRGDSKK